jgi:hypothetical protein
MFLREFYQTFVSACIIIILPGAINMLVSMLVHVAEGCKLAGYKLYMYGLPVLLSRNIFYVISHQFFSSASTVVNLVCLLGYTFDRCSVKVVSHGIISGTRCSGFGQCKIHSHSHSHSPKV